MRVLPVEIQGVSLEQIKKEMAENGYPNLDASRVVFFKSLAKWPEPTPKQAYWIRHLYAIALGLIEQTPATVVASTQDVEEAPKAPEANYKGVFKLFETASKKLKKPKISLKAADNKSVVLSVAGPNSKYHGSINVTDGGAFGVGTWYGAVNPNGEFKTKFGMSEEKLAPVKALLSDLAANPKSVAEKYGKMTGYCCFCAKALTDPQSVKAGFGPVCAANYGLLDEYKGVKS